MSRKLARRRTARGWRMSQSESFQQFLKYPINTIVNGTVKGVRHGISTVRRKVSGTKRKGTRKRVAR